MRSVVARKNCAVMALDQERKNIRPNQKKIEILKRAAALLELNVARSEVQMGNYDDAVINIYSALSIILDGKEVHRRL